MPHPRVRLAPTDADIPDGVLRALRDRFAAVRAELGLSLDYPGRRARRGASGWRPRRRTCRTRDETDLPFFTVDPPGSMDLDQAMHLERDGDGHRIRYAIADVPGLRAARRGARPGHPRARPDRLLPRRAGAAAPRGALARRAASLLPDAVRPAFVWDLRLDGAGALTSAEVYRAMVRSVERLDYAEVQAAVDAGTDDERFLPAARDRGAADRPGARARRARACRCPSSR